jgi:uncharacterized protein YPO0396
MDASQHLHELKEELDTARAVEAECLRRAHRLRAIAAPYNEIDEAMREVDAAQSQVAVLHLRYRDERRALAAAVA